MSELTNLPNIGATLAEKLQAIGVSSYDDLAALGSVEALIKIGAATGSGCYNMLYALEGAIQGVRWHSLPPQLRQELKRQLDIARDRQPIMPNKAFQRTYASSRRTEACAASSARPINSRGRQLP